MIATFTRGDPTASLTILRDDSAGYSLPSSLSMEYLKCRIVPFLATAAKSFDATSRSLTAIRSSRFLPINRSLDVDP